MAVHARPAAFEGADGMSYSVDIATDETGDPARPVGAYLLFLRWGGGHGEPSISGHLETDFLALGGSEEAVRREVGALPLEDVKRTLDALLRERRPLPSRPWWETMNE